MMVRRHTRNWPAFFALATLAAFFWIFVTYNSAWCPNVNEIHLREKELQILETKLQQQMKQVAALQDMVRTLQMNEENKKDKVQMQQDERKSLQAVNPSLPVIFAITPTYSRPEQKAELTRLSHTFRHLKNFHWVVIEDFKAKTKLVTNFLEKCGLFYTHLNIATPPDYKLKDTDPNWLKPRGVLQRNAGLGWIRENFDPNHEEGVVYFADDDNTYDLQLFDEMRHTEKVSVWPVGLVGYLRYESPVVKDGKVVSWFTYWKRQRQFAMDMAGFAVNAKLFLDHPSAWFDMKAGRGNLESSLLTQLGLTLDDLEPRADNCTKVLVWHTKTQKSQLKNEEKMKTKYGEGSDPRIEV